MRNSSEIWCETADIAIDEIERRACREVELGNFPTLVFISMDLLAELSKTMGTMMRSSANVYPGSQIMSIVTSAGSLNVKPVRRLRNFLLVARLEDFQAMEMAGFDQEFWNDEERKRINQAFEDLVILEGKE